MSRLTLLTLAMAGACLVSLYTRASLLGLGILGGLFFLAGLLMGIWRGRQGWRRTLRWLCLGLGIGFGWFAGYTALVRMPVQALEYETISLEARVIDYPQTTDYGLSVTVKGGPAQGSKTRLLLYLDRDYADLAPGDSLSCVAYCKPATVIQGQYRPYYPAKGVHLLASAQGQVTVTPATSVSLWDLPALAAGKARQLIDELYPPETAPFLRALLTGDKSHLSDEIQNAFSRTGLSHVVVVSGLHVSFLAGFLFLFLNRNSKLSVGILIGVIFFFAAMTGSSPGSVRAAILCAAGLLAPLLGREKDLINTLFAALLLMLLWNPWAAASAGLQFSFASTLGIYCLGLPLHGKWRRSLPQNKLRPPLDLLAGTLAISLGAMAVTVPLSALYFGQTSLIAPVSNLLTSWAVSLAFLGGALSLAAGAVFLPLGAGLAALASLPAGFFLACARTLSRLPFAGLSMDSVYYVWWVVFAYGLILLTLLWPGRVKRPLLPLCACVTTLCLSMVLTSLSGQTGDLRVQVLDVGQGQSVALVSQDYTALIDCGGTKDPGATAASYFHSLGISRIDLLVLTHFHDDHANGVLEFLDRVAVTAIAIPQVEPDSPLRQEIETLAGAAGTEVWTIETLSEVSLGQANLTLYPPATGDKAGNEACMALLATVGEWDALITGDLDQQGELDLLNSWAVPDVELLVAGHHGSASSSGSVFLRQVKPELAVLSVGYNHYGHPAPETLDRLAQAGAEIYRTDQMGAITVRAERNPD